MGEGQLVAPAGEGDRNGDGRLHGTDSPVSQQSPVRGIVTTTKKQRLQTLSVTGFCDDASSRHDSRHSFHEALGRAEGFKTSTDKPAYQEPLVPKRPLSADLTLDRGTLPSVSPPRRASTRQSSCRHGRLAVAPAG